MDMGPVFITQINPTHPNPSMKNIPLHIITTVMSQRKYCKDRLQKMSNQTKSNG